MHRLTDNRPPSSPTVWRLLGLLAVAGAAACLSAAPALGARGHVFGRTIGWGVVNGSAELQTCTAKQQPCKPGIAGSGKGQFSGPAGVAVNEASEDFYVVDKGNNRVERFSASDAFLGQFDASGSFEVEGVVKADAKPPSGKLENPETIAVDNTCAPPKTKAEKEACEKDPSKGDVYVQEGSGTGRNLVDKFGADGEYIGQLLLPGRAEGVAVARGGELLVSVVSEGDKRFYKFTNAVANLPGEPPYVENTVILPFEPGLAVDGAGNLYSGVIPGHDPSRNKVIAKFNAKGELLNEEVDPERASDVATELPSNDVYIDNLTKIRHFNSSEPPVEQENPFGVGQLIRGAGLAVDSASREAPVYVADEGANDIVEFPLEPPGPPTVERESVTEVTANSAALQAEVNPRGATSEYHFEYGPCSSEATCAESPYEKEVPQPEGTVGAPFDFDGHAVSAHPQDLKAGTVYHFRAVAHNEKSKGAPRFGEEKVFTTQPSGEAFALPDGRAWEMVSPPKKRGTLIQHISEGVIQAAASGDALAYLTLAPTEAEPQGYGGAVQVLARRRAGGWSSADISLPHEGATGASIGLGDEYRLFSEDLSLAVAQPFGAFVPTTSEEATEQTPYERTNFFDGNIEEPCTSRCYTPIVKSAPNPFGEHPPGDKEGSCPPKPICGPLVKGASPDARQVAITSEVGLTEVPEDNGGLYEWSEGTLTLVSVVNGKPDAAGGGLGSGAGIARHAISADGTRVVWSDGTHLYLREVTEEPRTLQLDKGLTGTPIFQTASADDSKVFFIEEGPGPAHDRILYVYDIQAEKATQLTSASAPEAVGEQGSIIGASEDGSYAYVVANAKLAPGAVAGDCEGTSAAGKECNLYELHEEGGAWQTRLVAVLSGTDVGDWGGNQSGELPGVTARVSPNGRYLAFMSQNSLSGYDNRDANSAKADEEVFEFDAAAPGGQGVVCASCNPTGARPVGVSAEQLAKGITGGVPSNGWIAANVPGWTPVNDCCSYYQSRYLSNNGRLFFNSSDALAPQDGNSTEDVYQYEPPAIGNCTTAQSTYSARAAGCISLISSGASREESAFLDASESGGDVFFLTASQLTKEDFDSALDIYDAHQCSAASPCIPERASPPPPCQTEASCKAPPTPQPEIFGAPASATFSGLGNVIAPPPAPAVKPTNAQLLARALKACHAKYKHSKKRRHACEVKAHRRYPAKATKRAHRARAKR